MKRLPEFLRPTRSKLFLPLLIGLMLLVSSTINFLWIPKLADNVCSEEKNAKESENINKEMRAARINAEPDKVVSGLKRSWEEINRSAYITQSYREKLPTVFFFNPLILMYAAHTIYPLYPAPCDLTYIGPYIGLSVAQYHYTPGCRFYMSEEQYNCVLNGLTAKTEEFNSYLEEERSSNIIAPLPSPREVQRFHFTGVSAPEMAVHSLFIILLLYVLSCALFHWSDDRGTLIKLLPYVMIAIVIVIILGSILFNIFMYYDLFFGQIGKDSWEPAEIRIEEYRIINCTSTTQLNSTLIKELRLDEYYNISEEDNLFMCDNPMCFQICENINKSALGINVFGKTPSCVCEL